MMGVLQSCRQFLGDYAQASIHLQGDVPDEQQLILLTDGDPPIPQVLLPSFEMCWRDDGSLTFALVLASFLPLSLHQVRWKLIPWSAHTLSFLLAVR